MILKSGRARGRGAVESFEFENGVEHIVILFITLSLESYVVQTHFLRSQVLR